MTSERWQEVEEIFQAAIDRPPQERASFLDEACAGDDELKSEAEELIEAYAEAGEFIEQPALAQDARVLIGTPVDHDIGRAIGPYTIVERLGAGGMGEVYLAEDGRLKRPVALKVLPAYFVSDDTRLRRFQREARAASALNHPNILTIYEVGESAEAHFIATEFIDGQTIRELIAGKVLSLAQILEIAEQIAFALSAAHAAGIVHRDIKPENIMRRADGIVKILDFGIAKLLETEAAEFQTPEQMRVSHAQTEAGIIMGTVNYMSPEQARALPVDERTDIWSLGIVLYEMLTGRVPFRGATRLDTLVGILEREPAPLFPAPEEAPRALQSLERIIGRALRKERNERYQTVTELLEDLKGLRHELALATASEENAVAAVLLETRHAPDGEFAASGPTASTILASADIPSLPQTHQNKRSPQHLWMAAIALLLAALAGMIFYGRLNASRRQGLPGANPQGAVPTVAAAKKLYAQMNEEERLAFVDEQEQRISAMMGERPARLNEEALRVIKGFVDRYAARRGSTSTEFGKMDLRTIYARAEPYVPFIARSFAARKVPVIIGVYLPIIESEYTACLESGKGAKGLFQFLPRTARLYGVAEEEMCDVEKMTPAAANYIADRMAELGDDAESMTLVILSYNRGPEGVRDALRQLRETEGYQRNFWTLFAHRDRLDQTFRDENAYYVPLFFAAAIIGENPQVFELQTPPLSTLIDKSAPAKP